MASSSTPRSRATRRAVVSRFRPSSVARTMFADDLVRDRPARERHFCHLAARGLDGFAHRFADLVRLAGRDSHVALAVPDRDERVEAEAPAALHDLRDAIDRDDVFHHAVVVAPTPVVAPLATPAPAASAASTTAPAPTAAPSGAA